jgi:hypothetical protein
MTANDTASAADARFIKHLCDQIAELNDKVSDWSVRAEKAERERDALKVRMSSMADVVIAQSKTTHAIEQRAAKAESRVAELEKLLAEAFTA